ncbi:MAG TPA: hypothetical protein VK212_05730 [Lentimicrobium sp.]|nr:hypothetical protein [Lentimicrobium sp.]
MQIDVDSAPWIDFINKCTEYVQGVQQIKGIPGEHPQLIATIVFKYKSFHIEFIQEILINTLNCINPHPLTFKCEFESPDEYFFSCSPLGFLDKFFNPNRYRSEHHELNKQFLIETSDERLTDKLLKVDIIRNELLTNKVFLLHSMSENGKTIVTIKLLEQRFYSMDEFIRYVSILYSVLDLMRTR